MGIENHFIMQTPELVDALSRAMEEKGLTSKVKLARDTKVGYHTVRRLFDPKYRGKIDSEKLTRVIDSIIRKGSQQDSQLGMDLCSAAGIEVYHPNKDSRLRGNLIMLL